MEQIALFPLEIVIFPESAFPLHIFEERYKKLVNESLEKKMKFGINLITSSKLFEVGCIVEVSDVMRRYDDGKMDILIVGKNRYRYTKHQEGRDGYLLAEIEYFEDIHEEFDPVLCSMCITVFNQIAESITSTKIEKLNENKLTTSIPSYLIAQNAGLTLIQKQKLLEVRSENERLAFLLKHLQSILPMVKETEYVNQIIKGDGYYKTKHI